MSDPRHAHEFDPNRRGLCKQYVGGMLCHLPETAEVHTRYADRVQKNASLIERVCVIEYEDGRSEFKSVHDSFELNLKELLEKKFTSVTFKLNGVEVGSVYNFKD